MINLGVAERFNWLHSRKIWTNACWKGSSSWKPNPWWVGWFLHARVYISKSSINPLKLHCAPILPTFTIVILLCLTPDNFTCWGESTGTPESIYTSPAEEIKSPPPPPCPIQKFLHRTSIPSFSNKQLGFVQDLNVLEFVKKYLKVLKYFLLQFLDIFWNCLTFRTDILLNWFYMLISDLIKVTFWTIQRQILLISRNAFSSVFSPWICWYMALNVLEKSLNLTLSLSSFFYRFSIALCCNRCPGSHQWRTETL